MDSQEVGVRLQECVEAAEKQIQEQHQHKPTEDHLHSYCSFRAGLCLELAFLLQQAEQMQWPFVPERWQYKESVEAQDKTNLSELIKKHLQHLLALLKSSILAQECCCALAVVFLVDRFLYWTDESRCLLKITKLLHRLSPGTPVAPQLVIRQARVYLNSGKLQKAEYILSGLINNSGATGCWMYQSDSDRALVQAVSVQVRGMILQKLGLWLQAAELIWASLVGYYALPQPDKKGIGTSLGLLANILVSMNDEDFSAFKADPDIDLSLLGESSHRLLSAAQAAKMAVVYSQYTSLYVLTNVVSQGTCVLSYSFSIQCPSSLHLSYLLQAREAFEIGLLTKSEGEAVTSIQELHTFLKAAYSLTVTHKWLGTDLTSVDQATQACQEALGLFYSYCHADNKDKGFMCINIMRLVGKVKSLLRVGPFTNSDDKSFIPDSYRKIKETPMDFTLETFSKMMQKLQKFHATLYETNRNCRSAKEEKAMFCITALGTTIGTLNTECSTDAKQELPGQSGLSSNSLGSSWHQLSLSNSLSSWQQLSLSNSLRSNSGSLLKIQTLPTTETDDDNNMGNSKNVLIQSPHSLNVQMIQAALETIDTENESELAKVMESLSQCSSNSLGLSWQKFSLSNSPRPSSECAAKTQNLPTAEIEDDNIGKSKNGIVESSRTSSASPHSLNFQLSQVALETIDTESEGENTKAVQSLSDSCGSNMSWEKLSADFPKSRKQLAKAESKSSESSESLFHLETLDSETSSNTNSNEVNPYMDKIASPKPNLIQANQCAATATSTDSSYEMLGQDKDDDKACKKEEKNALCHNCMNGSFADSPEGQYVLEEQDYKALLAGVCHPCLLKRLNNEAAKFQLKKHKTAYSALHLKFSKATGLWTARETCVYIGQPMGVEGKQRAALWVQFLHQEERLSSYVGKDYLKPREIQFHLKDVERQMTAQHYVTEFNKSLYDRDVMAQMFFIPSEALLILERAEIVGCVTVEPFMLGDFVKLTNNTVKKDKRFQVTEYGLAFGHFTYLLSDQQEVVVDLQGWVTANGKGLTYLTDPQIHSTKSPKGPSNFAERGLRYFLEEQHGPQCNQICNLLQLPPMTRQSPLIPPSL